MRRREFVALFGGSLAWPFAVCARAQQLERVLIGLLSSTSATPYKPFVDALFQGLKEEGFLLGSNVAIEQRWADGQYNRLPAFANELVRAQPNVIIAIAPPAARAAKAATSTIPIVFSTGSDPVALGLVSSLNRPGGNLTGVNFLVFAMVTKRVELLTRLAPTAGTIGVLVNSNNPSTARSTSDAHSGATSLGRKLIVASAGTTGEIEAGFSTFLEQKVGAVAVEPDPFLLANREWIVALAARYALPAIYPHREYAEAGGLAAYGTNIGAAYRQIGVYAGRILKGERPADLPVMQSTKFELLINSKTAKALNLVVPTDVLALSDEVIE